LKPGAKAIGAGDGLPVPPERVLATADHADPELDSRTKYFSLRGRDQNNSTLHRHAASVATAKKYRPFKKETALMKASENQSELGQGAPLSWKKLGNELEIAIT